MQEIQVLVALCVCTVSEDEPFIALVLALSTISIVITGVMVILQVDFILDLLALRGIYGIV